MHALVKAASAIHHISLAAAYGGPLFAKVALHPAVVAEIKDEKERVRLMEKTWSKFTDKVNLPAHIAFTVTYLIERRAIKQIHLDRRAKVLLAVKDVLVAGALVTGLANIAVGKKLARELPGGVPAKGSTESTQAVLAKYRKFYKVMGPLNMAFVAGSIVIGPYLGAAIFRSAKKNFLARLFSR
jgi:hypothetical protein